MRIILAIISALLVIGCGGLNHSVRSHEDVHRDLERCKAETTRLQAENDSLMILLHEKDIEIIKIRRKKDF